MQPGINEINKTLDADKSASYVESHLKLIEKVGWEQNFSIKDIFANCQLWTFSFYLATFQ